MEPISPARARRGDHTFVSRGASRGRRHAMRGEGRRERGWLGVERAVDDDVDPMRRCAHDAQLRQDRGGVEPMPASTARGDLTPRRVQTEQHSGSPSTSVVGSACNTVDTKTPSRTRHWVTPTAFRSSTNTSPGPRPGKADDAVGMLAFERAFVHSHPSTRSLKTSAHHCPTRSKLTCTS